MKRVRLTPEERFWAKVGTGTVPPHRPDLGECWPWLGATAKKNYGKMWWDGKLRSATHIAWFIRYGEWPTLFVLHYCDNPPCVRWEHLWQGTNAENVQDMIAKGRSRSGSSFGDDNGSRRHPERLNPVRGDVHWAHRDPARAVLSLPRLRGEDNPSARLNWPAVREIRRRYAAGGISQQALADEFGVSQVAVSLVIRGEKWRE